MDKITFKDNIEQNDTSSVKLYTPLLEINDLKRDDKSGKDFEKINHKIFALLNQNFDIPLNIDQSKVNTKNFIFTENAIRKLKEIKYYLSHNYPVLLEGPTGTAKTKSVEILCEEMGRPFKRFNLSSETKTADLFGRYVGDPKSFSGISFQEGVFIEAFKNGYILLLDEINLASSQVLQSFEECLDSHKISCEIPGMPWQEIKMGEGFCLIATQNPNKGLFANKRQELGKKFLSRFHIINFDSFQKDELYQIAKGLGDKNKISPQIIKELVYFHDEWSNQEERKNDILCFTIREIEATINAVIKGENIKEAILSIYGSRYKSNEYEKLKVVLNKYPNLISDNGKSKFNFNNEFLYVTPLLEKVLKSIILSFDNNRHVLILGDEGTGKTQIAKYIAEYRDKINNNIDIGEGIYYCQCTEDLKCSDLIGNQYPFTVDDKNDKHKDFQGLMKWEDGFLTSAIINGKSCILDNIEEAPATITERLNGLLDKKLNIEKDLIFEIPECPQKKEVNINKNFRLLCVCNYNGISKMSPAFLNRFDIITLEDQLKPLSGLKNSEKIFLEFIDTIMKQHSFNYQANSKQNEEYNKKVEEEEEYGQYMDLSLSNLDLDKNIKNIEFKYEKNEKLNKLIYGKILNNIKNSDLSIYKLSLFCRAVYIFMQELDPNKEIKLDKLVNYAYQMIISPNIEDDKEIEDFIYEKYFVNYESQDLIDNNHNKDNKFFFKESPKLKSFMAKLFAASMINLHLCIIGKTGVGKTSCARQFSRIRTKLMKLSKEFYMHSFHSNTKPNHIYGNITMKNNKIEFIKGSLLNSMEYGQTFIADEMNLSPDIVMKSLVPALDLNLNSKIFIPGIKDKIQINQKFFFISCQNDFTTTGRNSLPKLLAKKLKCISYPEPPKEDIENICKSINLDLHGKYNSIKNKGEENELEKNGINIAKFMDKLNNLKLSYIPNWSIRDITKVLKRVQFQSSDKNIGIYDNISFIDNIIFYTLSSIYKKDINDTDTRNDFLDKLLNILISIFDLNDNEIKNIKNIFDSEVIITKEENSNFLRKGKCGISLEKIIYFKNAKESFRLPSLYNELFQILLAHDEEPILIIGESGYKTYLSKLLLKDVKPIQLNAETTIGQLLGSTIFLSDKEVKIFYLNQIYLILDEKPLPNEIRMVQRWVDINESNEKKILEEQEKLREKIKNKILIKRSQVSKFKKTIEILEEKLFNNNNDKKKNLNNMNLEFKPGLILNSILSGKSLILKYLSNLPTVVLERFNELFSGNHNLTLNEDIHDTFTKEGNKEFENLGENFRIFATCSLGEQNKLSEAVLSRFTIICSDKYKQNEQKDVLKSYLIDKKLDFNDNCIQEVIKFSENIKNNSLSLMINALSLSNQNELFKEDIDNTRLNILSFILYRIFYGMSYKIKLPARQPSGGPALPDDPIYYEKENEILTYLPKMKKEQIILGENVNEEPLFETKINGTKYIESKYNKLQVEYGIGENIAFNESIAFTRTFTEMVDYIHLGIATNTPVILEGGTGLGKQTAINYVANKLNYRIINYIITASTKIEDLLGRNQIIREDGQIKIEFCETKILKVLIDKETKAEEKNIIIVFHNLNKASSALMESLCSIFNKEQTNILRPDGRSELKKGKFNLIGIINSQSNIAIKDKLPVSLINCVFYYILPKLSSDDIEKIITKKFEANNLMDEYPDFIYCFNKSREFSHKKGNISYFSLNDITKYIKFRNETKDSLDKNIILQMIFAYRFIQSEFIKDIIKELGPGFLSMKINPIFRYKDEYLSISFKKKDKKEIQLLYDEKYKINQDEILEKLNTLNTKQKQCLLFLVLSLKCKRACIIQGDTAAGKTHLVRLFAEMIGQKLIVYQINKETGLSIFTGQSTLLNDLDDKEISIIKNHFEKLSKNKDFQSYLNNYFLIDSYYSTELVKNKWSVDEFKKLIIKIEEYIKKNNAKLKEDDYKDYKKIANDLNDMIQPYKRFKKQKSKFLEALEKGYWVLIDGIESANPVISDKLIRLCDENPELDLRETGENIVFSKNNSSNNKINENFHLFINYNPLNKSNNNQLNEMFLNKCLTFTLVPMDVDLESSFQIVYGYLKNSNKINNDNLCQEISSKIALIHQAMNKKIEENQEFFSGGVEFTGRIIKYISEEISKSNNEIELCENLVNALYLNYINSINNKNDEKNIKEVKEIIKNNLLKKSETFDTGENNIYLKYSRIFIILKNIQKVANNILPNYEFNFFNLLELIKRVEISDLYLVNYYIKDTLKILDKFLGNSIKNKIKYFDYFYLEIIKKLIENVLDYVKLNGKNYLLDFSLNDEDELINKKILTKEISKINLVFSLTQENFLGSFIYLPDEVLKFIESIKNLLENVDINDLYENLKIIQNLMYEDINVIQLFPFNQILLERNHKNEKKIRMFKIVYLIYKMIDNKINFQLCHDSNILKFNFENDKIENFSTLFIQLNLDKDFYFNTNCKIINKIEAEEKLIIGTSDNYKNDEQKIKVNNWFYIIFSGILDNKIKINDKEKKKEIIKNVSQNKIKIFDEIDEEFEKEIKNDKRTYRIINLISRPEEDDNTREYNLIAKIWFIILFYEKEKIDLITPTFCLPFEKELIEGIRNMYENIDIKHISKVITFTKNFRECKNGNTNLIYGNSNTFLYKIQSGFFNYLFIEDKDKMEYCTQIKNEMKWYNKFISPFNNFWTIGNSIECLNSQYISLKGDIENLDQIEKYKNKLHELISEISDYKLEGNKKIDENYKEKLIQFLRTKLTNPTKEVYESCKVNVDDYLKNLNKNLSENQITFNFKKSNYYDSRDRYIICFDILRTYSIQHKMLSKIFKKSKNILSDISKLDKEIDIVSNILFQYAFDQGEFIRMYEKKVMGIIRALVLYKIIKFSQKEEQIKILFGTFLELYNIINDQIGGNSINFNKNILNWTTCSIQTDLEDYFIIPKFEAKDFLYLFLIVYKEEKENNENEDIIKRSEGFLFKNSISKYKNLLSILKNSLEKYDQQELNLDFPNYMGKIAHSLLEIIFSDIPDKYNNNFKNLSYIDLIKELRNERTYLNSRIKECGLKNEPKENFEMYGEIIKQILNCFYLAITYDQKRSIDSKLKYEDIEFFKNKNWNKELVTKYPGMVYYLSKNYKSSYSDLMTKKTNNGCFIHGENQISFWYFQIRVLSNIELFEYDCYNEKEIEIHGQKCDVKKELENENNNLKDKIEKYIKEKIISLIKASKPVNINWINLALKDVPSQLKIISNKSMELFYEFFANLLADSNTYQKEIKNIIISDYIIQVFDLIFDNKIEELFNKNIENCNDEIIKLINKPQEELINKIKKKNQERLLEEKIKKNINNTLQIFKNIKKDVPKIIDKINDIVKQKTKEYHNNYETQRNREMKKIENNIQEELEKTKEEINQCLDIIKDKKLQEQDILNNNIDKLTHLMNNKKYFNYPSEFETIYFKLTMNTLLRSNLKYVLKIKNKNNKHNEKIQISDKTRILYLQYSIFDENDIKNLVIFKDEGNGTYTKKLNIKTKFELEKFEFPIFNRKTSFNSVAKDNMIKDKEKEINLSEPKIKFEGKPFEKKKLDKFMNSFKNFDVNLLEKTNKYNENLKSEIKKIINEIKTLYSYLDSLHTENGENDKELEVKVTEIKNIILNCQNCLNENFEDVKTIIDINNKIEGDKIFLEEHDRKIPFHKEPSDKNYRIFIKNETYLKQPMISDDGKSIQFSSNSFQMFLGSYIPSIISSPIIIKLLNLKQNKIKANIKDSNKQIVDVDEIEENENNLKININIQNLKSDELNEKINEKIIFNLEISSDGYEKKIIPFNLNINLVPLCIIFKSMDYKLNYDLEENIFNLMSSVLYTNSEIQFCFSYLYKSNIKNQLNDNKVDFKYSLNSLENNKSIKPEIREEKNKLILKILNNEDPQNNILSFILKIYFSNTFYINIKFNSKISQFNFELKWYSYDQKKFIDSRNDMNIYIDKYNIRDHPYDYILYFKVEQKFDIKTRYDFSFNLPKVIIKENDFGKNQNKKEFIFSVKLSITKVIESIDIHDSYFFEIKGNQVRKRIKVKFKNIYKETNLIDELYTLPKYSFEKKENANEYKIDKNLIYITPFNFYIPYASNLYLRDNINPDYEKRPTDDFEIYSFYPVTKQFKFLKREEFNKFNNDHRKPWAIIGIFNKDKWYPIERMDAIINDRYIDDIFQDFENLEYKRENIKKAEDMIDRINNDNDYWSLPTIIQFYHKKIERYEAHYLGFINNLPHSIFKEIKNDLDKLNRIQKKGSFEFYSIFSNNLIFIFYKLFKARYEQINNNKNILYLTNIKIDKDLFNKLNKIMEQKRKEYFMKNDREFSDLKNDSIFSEIEKDNKINEYNIFLLHENKNPESVEDNIEQIPLEEKDEKIMMKDSKSDKFDLSNISLPELKIPSTYSINEITDYYNNCYKITNILYFYIISASKNKNDENQLKAGNYRLKLLSISKEFNSKQDYSFFSIVINQFLNGMYNLTNELKKIGFTEGNDKQNILPRFAKELTYLIFPKKISINKNKDNWKTEKIIGSNNFRQEEVQTGRIKANILTNNNFENIFDDNDSDSEEENNNYNNISQSVINNINIDIKNIKVLDIDDDNEFNENINDINNNDSILEFSNIKNDKENKVKLGKITDKFVNIDPVQNIKESNFKEEDGINRALKALKLEQEKKKSNPNIKQKLDLGNIEKSHIFNNMDIFNLDIDNKLTIQQLYTKSGFLANQLFIKINGNGKVKYFDTLVIFLIDPSVYISEEIKLLNMFIICAMTNALNCLEIKYSVFLMGDEEFRCVLKDYNEPHSIEALERVYECLMLRRFRTNIPGCLKYTLKEISNKSDFENTSFFIFTDGLDKAFTYTQKNTWDINIFNKKANSFGFIFLLSSILTNENKEFLKALWSTFEKESNNNSASKIFMESLELKIDEDFKNKLNEIFLKTLLRTKLEPKKDNEYKLPIFEIKNENSLSNFLKNNEKLLDDKSLYKINESFIKNERASSSLNTNKEPLEINYYKSNLHQIAKKSKNNKDDIENNVNLINFSHKFLSIRANLNRGILEEIFKPNKANLKVLSNTGTEIDIMALILYFLNPVPDPMIYLQDAIGNVKEYSITVIIDTSFSVLNHMNIIHSLNTIRVLLSSFTIIDLPSFDLILTGENGPIVLCSEYPTFAALNEKSKLWEVLFQCLSKPILNADLLSALKTAFDLKRMRTNNFPSFLFVLTDGLYGEETQNQLKEFIAKLSQNNINIIGIGLGIYPYGINNIFGQAIYDINPINLLHSILSIMEGNISDKKEMEYIQKEEEENEKIKTIISKIISNHNYVYKLLRKELEESPLKTNSYDMMNEEVDGGVDKEGRPINPKGDEIGLLQGGSLSGQKILIVMLWSCVLSSREDEKLHPDYIEKPYQSNSKSIKNSVEYLGVEVKTVLNYKDAIKEITNKDSNGKCNYYTVWVMCGHEKEDMPDKTKDPGFVEQFIDCLILYWENGGSVVLFCDNEPLYFQANMFLEKIRFKGEITKTKLRIEGNDPGEKNLIGKKVNGNLDGRCMYDQSKIIINGTERMPLGHNVPQIYEGKTISRANSNNREDIKPFIPFGVNSSGNYCMLIYGTQGKEGDIFIDCGYTKVFFNMDTEESATWRFIQNLAGFLARPEIHMRYDGGITQKNYRPNGVNFKINNFNLYKYNYGSGELDIVYMIDSTGSMGSWINGVKEKCIEILKKLNENPKLENYDIKFGGVFYRDPVDQPKDIHEEQPLKDVNELQTKLASISATGGGDIPEDWVGAYEIVLNDEKMKWRKDSKKIIIHIADAGAHTLRFSDGDTKHNTKDQEIKLVDLIKKCAKKKISIFGYQINQTPKKSFVECKKIYDSVKQDERKEKCSYEINEFNNVEDKEVADKLEENIINDINHAF